MTKLTVGVTDLEELMISSIRNTDNMDTFCHFAEDILGLNHGDVRYDPELDVISIDTELSLDDLCIMSDEIRKFGITVLPDIDRRDQ